MQVRQAAGFGLGGLLRLMTIFEVLSILAFVASAFLNFMLVVLTDHATVSYRRLLRRLAGSKSGQQQTGTT